MKNDPELFADAMAGGPEAFAPIVERYQDAVFGIALARVRNFHQAEDLAAGVFVEAFERLGNLNDPARLGAWLRTITIHHCIDHLRKRREVTGIEQMPVDAGGVSTWRAQEERRDIRDEVLTAIGRLSKVQRETTTLFYINGYSIHEVAAMQEVPAGTVKRRLHDARERLKVEMMDMVENVLKSEAPREDFAQRVLELVSSPNIDYDWGIVIEELRRIGAKGVDGFAQALRSQSSAIRGFAARMIKKSDLSGDTIVELMKEGLADSHKMVRKVSVAVLLTMPDVSDERKRKEFVPLVVPMLSDPSKLVRQKTAGYLRPWAAEVSLAAAVQAMLDDKAPRCGLALEHLVRAIIEVQNDTDAQPGNAATP